MRKLLIALWRVITFPFILIYKLITLPFRAIRNAYRFLNLDPEEDRPLIDSLASLATESQARASLWDHVEELRMHLLRMVIALAIGVGVSFYFTVPLMEYLARPVEGLDKLQAIKVTEEIGVYMRVALASGIVIMLPYLVFEIWLFIAPGLRAREKKIGLIGIPFATALFVSGVAFTYFLLLPPAITFLGRFTKIQEFWTASDYFGFVTSMMLWIGLFFEFPLIIYILTAVGFIDPRILAQQWRLAIVIIAVIAAAVTPTIDPITMGLVMLPMSFLYFVSIGLSYIAYAGRKTRAEKADQTEANIS